MCYDPEINEKFDEVHINSLVILVALSLDNIDWIRCSTIRQSKSVFFWLEARVGRKPLGNPLVQKMICDASDRLVVFLRCRPPSECSILYALGKVENFLNSEQGRRLCEQFVVISFYFFILSLKSSLSKIIVLY